jgi:iron complex outermembrane receptor protein
MHQANFINYRYFIPRYQSVDIGFWAAEKYQFKQWQFELGLRYDRKNRFSIKDNDASPNDILMGNVLVPGSPYGARIFSGIAGTGVAAYKLNEQVRVSFTTSTAWRSPQVNELFSNGLHHGAARIEKGDPSLKIERAFSNMASILFNKNKFEVDIGIYNKFIDGFIYLLPIYPPLLTIRGAFPAFNYAQTNAILSGADFSFAYLIGNHVKSHVKGSLLRAYDQHAKTWLIQMPADRYELQLEYIFPDSKKLKQSSIQLAFQHVTEQTRIPATGNIKVKLSDGSTKMASDYMPPPPAYSLINLDASSDIIINKKTFNIIFSIQNLLNTSYRDYMNAFRYFSLDRGRNISLKVKIPF